MATSSPYIGRREAVGLGIEATPGTGVAAQTWLRWLDQDVQNKVDIVENESAMGVVEKVNDSEIVAKWAEGKLSGKVTAESVGFLLLGMFGTVTDGSVSGGVYPHTFAVKQSSIPTALTITRVNPLKTQRHSYGVIESFELSSEAGGWVEVSCGVKARVGADATDTPAFTDETEFTSKHITLKTAADTSGLAAAPALSVKSVKLTVERSSEVFNPLGTDDEPEFDLTSFEAKGEFVVRYTDTQVEDDFLSNALHAMSIKMSNGTDSLEFTASKVRYRELEKSSDRDGVVTQTISFYCEFDTATNSSIVPVLKNGRATYVAA